MTIREKLADWISGGVVSRIEARNKKMFEDCKDMFRQSEESLQRRINAEGALRRIANATASGKSGTAKKIHRMATEALK